MESTPEQTAEGAAIVKVLADVLERLVSSNSSLARQDPGQITKFHALKAPGIGILQYLERYVMLCFHVMPAMRISSEAHICLLSGLKCQNTQLCILFK